MDVRVITLRYQDALQGFSEEALRKAISGREEGLEEARRPLYRELKHWRNERAEKGRLVASLSQVGRMLRRGPF